MFLSFNVLKSGQILIPTCLLHWNNPDEAETDNSIWLFFRVLMQAAETGSGKTGVSTELKF